VTRFALGQPIAPLACVDSGVRRGTATQIPRDPGQPQHESEPVLQPSRVSLPVTEAKSQFTLSTPNVYGAEQYLSVS